MLICFLLFFDNVEPDCFTYSRSWFAVCVVSVKERKYVQNLLPKEVDGVCRLPHQFSVDASFYIGSETYMRCWHLVICLLMCVYTSVCASTQMHTHTHTHTCLAVYDSSVAWQPGRVCLLIHMILFGIDRAVFHPLPLSSLCPPPLLLSSAPSQGKDGGEGWRVPNPLLCSRLLRVPRHKHKLLVSWPLPICLFSSVFFILLSTSHLCLRPFLSTFHLLFFLSHPSPLLRLFLPFRSSFLSRSLSLHRQFQFTSGS